MRVETVRDALRLPLELEVGAEIDPLLNTVAPGRRSRAREALFQRRLGARPIGGLYLLRLSPKAPFLEQLRDEGVLRRVGALGVVHALQYVLWILAWWILGAAAFSGFDGGWFAAWWRIRPWADVPPVGAAAAYFSAAIAERPARRFTP